MTQTSESKKWPKKVGKKYDNLVSQLFDSIKCIKQMSQLYESDKCFKIVS